MFFDGTATAATDTRDGRKLSNPGLDFYTKATDNEKLAIDVRPLAVGDVVPLGLRADSQRTYAIKVADYEAPAGMQLYLRDKFLNQSTPLSQGMSYSFEVTSNPLSQGDDRFELTTSWTTGIEQTNGTAGIEIAMSPNPANSQVTISLGGVKGRSTVTITDMTGQVMNTSVVESLGSVQVPLQDWSAGVYIVTVRNGEIVKTQKLIKN